MKKERCIELLNQIIDHTSVARNIPETIEELMEMGFTPDELVNEFNFCEEDVYDITKNQK